MCLSTCQFHRQLNFVKFFFAHISFSKEAQEARHPCAFMPFGNGPRVCVAMRFANLEGKVGLARLLQKYNFELDPQTPVSINYMYVRLGRGRCIAREFLKYEQYEYFTIKTQVALIWHSS